MKKKDIQELKTRPAASSQSLIRESNEKLRELRFDLAAGKVKNVAELHRDAKRDRAYKDISSAETMPSNNYHGTKLHKPNNRKFIGIVVSDKMTEDARGCG